MTPNNRRDSERPFQDHQHFTILPPQARRIADWPRSAPWPRTDRWPGPTATPLSCIASLPARLLAKTTLAHARRTVVLPVARIRPRPWTTAGPLAPRYRAAAN